MKNKLDAKDVAAREAKRFARVSEEVVRRLTADPGFETGKEVRITGSTGAWYHHGKLHLVLGRERVIANVVSAKELLESLVPVKNLARVLRENTNFGRRLVKELSVR